MAEKHETSIPDQGQIVTVRQRRFVVADIQKSSLPIDPLSNIFTRGQHLVTLTSIEDDAQGETLQVIWEVEPGARVEDSARLPAPIEYDPPHRFDAFMHAVRWGAVSSADFRALQAPFRSGIDIEDYQLAPLVRAIQMPRVNLLIADDVGLGKTIEAGLVIQELVVRNRARTVLIVCPAGLQIHWRDQIREKFGLEFRIVDTDLMKDLRRSRGIHVNPWAHFPRLITSIDFLKRERPMRLFREIVPGEPTYPRRFDILVVDEAHNVSPSGVGNFAIDSLRTQAIRTIAPHFEHKLFLTATPHNGYAESFSSLLELLDNQRFARSVLPDRRQLEAVMVRRLKSELVDFDGKPRFPTRCLEAIEVAYPEEERRVHQWLREYSRLRLQNARDNEERYAAEFVLKLLKKRLFSSPAAFAITLNRHYTTLTTPKTKSTRLAGSGLGILRRQVAQMDESYADDDAYEEDTMGAVDTASDALPTLSPQEKSLLEQMRQWAERAAHRPDSKTQAFIAWLKQIVRPSVGRGTPVQNAEGWSDERVIIFTEYRATQNWLQTLLAAEGLTAGDRLMMMYGGMPGDQRERVKAAFQASPDLHPVRILLATDAASEGIDLQNHCHRLVHFEIPWNPNRMEQRNGRIDRHGQKYVPLIFHFVCAGYQHQPELLSIPKDDLDADLEFLFRAAEKVEQIREDLGKVGPVIAQQVEEAMLGRRIGLDTRSAEADGRSTRKMLKFERDLRKQIEQLYDQLQETRRDLEITPENVRSIVEIALSLAHQPPLKAVDSEDPVLKQAFWLPPLSGSWTACVEGMPHPLTGQMRPMVFDHNLARGREDVVLAHLNHRLVQMALRLLRAEVWAPGGRRGLNRVTARVVPDLALDAPAVIAHARLVLIGGDGRRLHEEIITAGGTLREGSFRRMNVGPLQTALAAATQQAASALIQGRLTKLWSFIEPALVSSLQARMEDRVDGMQKLLRDRENKEVADITAILNELARTIQAELKDPEYRQLELWSDSEREQLRRNEQALRLRLDQIPVELEQEIVALRKRYADPVPRLFPVAVTFLIPEKYNH
jgi:superfamily II DNA or RNA helicase